MAPSPSAGFRVIETSRVAPPPGTVPETTLPLTFLDLIWVFAGTVERVFFYSLPCPTSEFVDSILPTLKSSLSHTLRHFYPLAGTVRRSPDRHDGFEILYADGDSVSLRVAELDGEDFDDLSGSHEREFSRILPLLPEIPKSDFDGGSRLLALQVTVFPNQGVALAVSVHHAACDGSSSIHFLASWAAACARGAAPNPPPVLDRSLVVDPDDLYSLLYKTMASEMQTLEAMFSNVAHPDTVIESFTLGAAHIRRLKELVSAGGSPTFHCSSIVVTLAYVWVCFLKAWEIAGERYAPLGFAAECRAILRPPLPAAYFGNGLSACLTEERAGVLTGEGGMAVAAKTIGKAIEVFKADPFGGARGWKEKYKAWGVEKSLSVAGSPKFRVYDVDFGWGRPNKVEIPSIVRSGAISVAESRAEQGGVEVGLVLPKSEMSKFGAEFYRGLELLTVANSHRARIGN